MLKLCARPNKKRMILHHMQTANRQERERATFRAQFRGGKDCRLRHFHPKPRHDYFLCIHPGIPFQNEAAVIFRNGEAKGTALKFHVKISSMQQQVRPVERHTESHAKKTSRHHCNPRSKVSMMDMDVLDPLSFQ